MQMMLRIKMDENMQMHAVMQMDMNIVKQTDIGMEMKHCGGESS